MKGRIKMKADANHTDRPHPNESQPHRVRLPGFISEEEVGFGDVIKRTTSYFGVKPCGGCVRRADALNRWLVFGNR